MASDRRPHACLKGMLERAPLQVLGRCLASELLDKTVEPKACLLGVWRPFIDLLYALL